jgi:hypothetical protein
MRLLLALLLALPLLAQEKSDVKQEEKKPDAAQEKAADSPTPLVEKSYDGFVEAGYRWLGNVGGDNNTYRSVVNNEEGIRLSAAEFNYTRPNWKLLDEMHISVRNWGDPYNTARMDVGKQGLWRYRGSYSNTNYYNYLPSFADPGLATGNLMNQRAYDTAIKNYDNLLEFLPGTRLIPYLGFTRNSSFGTGITPLVVSGNEYPLRTNLDWYQTSFFGGIRGEFSHFHGTFEAGNTNFNDNQSVYSTDPSTGNRTSPYLGQKLTLNSGGEQYQVKGDGLFYKGLFTANPWSWIDLYGQFYYTDPNTTSSYSETVTGNLVYMPRSLFYQSGVDQFYGNSNMPHTSGSAATEIRPWSKLRIRYNFETDRFHSNSTGTLDSLITATTNPPASITASVDSVDRLEVTNNRSTIEAFLDLSRKFMLRGGYRYEWGEALVRAGQVNPMGLLWEPGTAKREIVLGGAQYRPFEKLTANVDLEHSDGKNAYFRTSLMDYWKVRAAVRYHWLNSLNISALYSLLDNKNDSAGVGLAYKSQQMSASIQWLPKGGKYLMLVGEYTRSTIYSDINYLIPAALLPAPSLYRDDANSVSAMVDLNLRAIKLSTGGAFVTTSGSRPSHYYQPMARVSVPIYHHVSFFSEWRYYGLTQPYYLYEGFRNNQLLTGLRFVL